MFLVLAAFSRGRVVTRRRVHKVEHSRYSLSEIQGEHHRTYFILKIKKEGANRAEDRAVVWEMEMESEIWDLRLWKHVGEKSHEPSLNHHNLV